MSVNQIVDLLYKNAQGIASTANGRSINQEKHVSNAPIYNNQVWLNAHLIPIEGPELDAVIALPNLMTTPGTPFVRRYIELQLLVTDSIYAFSHPLLVNAIPPRFGGLFAYGYVLSGLLGAIPGPTYLDSGAGILRIYDMDLEEPPTISFWRYEGLIGTQNAQIGPLTTYPKIGLISTMTIPQGFATINTILNVIVPPPAPDITTLLLAPADGTILIPMILSGDHAVPVTGLVCPFTLNSVSPYLTTINTIYITVNGVNSGIIPTTINSSIQVNGVALTVVANDLNLVSVSILVTSLRSGANTISVSQSPPYTFYVCNDTPAIIRTATLGPVVGDAAITKVSGLSIWNAGTAINVNVTAAVCGAFYRNNILINTAGTGLISNPLGVPPPYTDAGSYSDYVMAIVVAANAYTEASNVIVYAYNALGAATQRVIPSPYRVDTVSISAMLNFNRVTSGTTLTPGANSYGAPYDDSISLITNEELQVLNGAIQWPLNINYAGPLLLNPDYTTLNAVRLSTQYRWFTVLFDTTLMPVGNSNSRLLEAGTNTLIIRLYMFANADTSALVIPGISLQWSSSAAPTWIDLNVATNLDLQSQNGRVGNTLYRTAIVGRNAGSVYVRIGLPVNSPIIFTNIDCCQG